MFLNVSIFDTSRNHHRTRFHRDIPEQYDQIAGRQRMSEMENILTQIQFQFHAKIALLLLIHFQF